VIIMLDRKALRTLLNSQIPGELKSYGVEQLLRELIPDDIKGVSIDDLERYAQKWQTTKVTDEASLGEEEKEQFEIVIDSGVKNRANIVKIAENFNKKIVNILNFLRVVIKEEGTEFVAKKQFAPFIPTETVIDEKEWSDIYEMLSNGDKSFGYDIRRKFDQEKIDLEEFHALFREKKKLFEEKMVVSEGQVSALPSPQKLITDFLGNNQNRRFQFSQLMQEAKKYDETVTPEQVHDVIFTHLNLSDPDVISIMKLVWPATPETQYNISSLQDFSKSLLLLKQQNKDLFGNYVTLLTDVISLSQPKVSINQQNKNILDSNYTVVFSALGEVNFLTVEQVEKLRSILSDKWEIFIKQWRAQESLLAPEVSVVPKPLSTWSAQAKSAYQLFRLIAGSPGKNTSLYNYLLQKIHLLISQLNIDKSQAEKFFGLLAKEIINATPEWMRLAKTALNITNDAEITGAINQMTNIAYILSCYDYDLAIENGFFGGDSLLKDVPTILLTSANWKTIVDACDNKTFLLHFVFKHLITEENKEKIGEKIKELFKTLKKDGVKSWDDTKSKVKIRGLSLPAEIGAFEASLLSYFPLPDKMRKDTSRRSSQAKLASSVSKPKLKPLTEPRKVMEKRESLVFMPVIPNDWSDQEKGFCQILISLGEQPGKNSNLYNFFAGKIVDLISRVKQITADFLPALLTGIANATDWQGEANQRFPGQANEISAVINQFTNVVHILVCYKDKGGQEAIKRLLEKESFLKNAPSRFIPSATWNKVLQACNGEQWCLEFIFNQLIKGENPAWLNDFEKNTLQVYKVFTDKKKKLASSDVAHKIEKITGVKVSVEATEETMSKIAIVQTMASLPPTMTQSEALKILGSLPPDASAVREGESVSKTKKRLMQSLGEKKALGTVATAAVVSAVPRNPLPFKTRLAGPQVTKFITQQTVAENRQKRIDGSFTKIRAERYRDLAKFITSWQRNADIFHSEIDGHFKSCITDRQPPITTFERGLQALSDFLEKMNDTLKKAGVENIAEAFLIAEGLFVLENKEKRGAVQSNLAIDQNGNVTYLNDLTHLSGQEDVVLTVTSAPMQELSLDQVKELLKIYAGEKPQWYQDLPQFAQNYLSEKFKAFQNKTVDESVRNQFNQQWRVLPSSISQFISLRNAYEERVQVDSRNVPSIDLKIYRSSGVVHQKLKSENDRKENARLNYDQLFNSPEFKKRVADYLAANPNATEFPILLNTIFSPLLKLEDRKMYDLKEFGKQHFQGKDIDINGRRIKLKIFSTNIPINSLTVLADKGKLDPDFDQFVANASKNATGFLAAAIGVYNQIKGDVDHKDKAQNLFIAALQLAIASELGMFAHLTCKSGKDRTGIMMAMVEALVAYYAKYQEIPKYDDQGSKRSNFIEIYVNCLEHQFVLSELNTAGVNALQSMSGTFSNPGALPNDVLSAIAEKIGMPNAALNQLAKTNKPKVLKGKVKPSAMTGEKLTALRLTSLDPRRHKSQYFQTPPTTMQLLASTVPLPSPSPSLSIPTSASFPQQQEARRQGTPDEFTEVFPEEDQEMVEMRPTAKLQFRSENIPEAPEWAFLTQFDQMKDNIKKGNHFLSRAEEYRDIAKFVLQYHFTEKNKNEAAQKIIQEIFNKNFPQGKVLKSFAENQSAFKKFIAEVTWAFVNKFGFSKKEVSKAFLLGEGLSQLSKAVAGKGKRADVSSEIVLGNIPKARINSVNLRTITWEQVEQLFRIYAPENNWPRWVKDLPPFARGALQEIFAEERKLYSQYLTTKSEANKKKVFDAVNAKWDTFSSNATMIPAPLRNAMEETIWWQKDDPEVTVCRSSVIIPPGVKDKNEAIEAGVNSLAQLMESTEFKRIAGNPDNAKDEQGRKIVRVPILTQTVLTPGPLLPDNKMVKLKKEAVKEFNRRVEEELSGKREKLLVTTGKTKSGEEYLIVPQVWGTNYAVNTIAFLTAGPIGYFPGNKRVQRELITAARKEATNDDFLAKTVAYYEQLTTGAFGYSKVNNRYITALEQIIASRLGWVVHITCKSGKDRTGLVLAHTEAIAIYYSMHKEIYHYEREKGETKDAFKKRQQEFNEILAQVFFHHFALTDQNCHGVGALKHLEVLEKEAYQTLQKEMGVNKKQLKALANLNKPWKGGSNPLSNPGVKNAVDVFDQAKPVSPPVVPSLPEAKRPSPIDLTHPSERAISPVTAGTLATAAMLGLSGSAVVVLVLITLLAGLIKSSEATPTLPQPKVPPEKKPGAGTEPPATSSTTPVRAVKAAAGTPPIPPAVRHNGSSPKPPAASSANFGGDKKTDH
jgi:hypothetical protein